MRPESPVRRAADRLSPFLTAGVAYRGTSQESRPGGPGRTGPLGNPEIVFAG